MTPRATLVILLTLAAAACAEGAGTGETTGSTSSQGGSVGIGGSGTGVGGTTTTSTGTPTGTGGGTGTATACPPDEVVVGINSQGTLACAPVVDLLGPAIEGSCSIYVGWRDSCDGCTLAPSRWGRVDGQSCDPGEGASNTCSTATLGGQSVQLFGLNTGGDVGGDDKFYFALSCASDGAPPEMGPCMGGQVAVGLESGELLCQDLGEVAAAYVGGSCELFTGWRDSCGSCGLAPSKWGRVTTGGCANGVGADNTCTTPTLGADTVDTFGLNTDGDVNDDDKFYFGLGCAPATPATSTADTVCPAGEVMIGVEADGSITCDDFAAQVQAVFESDCYLYAGWRDSCSSCSPPPARWGRVSATACENGLGGTNTCTTDTLGGTMLHLFGLNTGGNVNDDDKFYFGLSCGG